VRTIPDTKPGIHFSHLEAVYGSVIFVSHAADGYWYRVQANDCGRKVTQAIPEHQVIALSKAINDDQIIGTCAIAAEPVKKLMRQLEAKDGELAKKEKVIKKLKARVELAAERLAEFKALESECKSYRKILKIGKKTTPYCGRYQAIAK